MVRVSSNNPNPNRADRIAREMINAADEFTITGIEDGLEELLNVDDLNRLFTAIDTQYPQYEKGIDEVEEHLTAIDEETLRSFESAYLGIMAARQKAYFDLGFCLAMKLVGRTTPPPTLKVVDKGEKCA